MIPLTALLINDLCLNSSLEYIFEICNSTIGIFIIVRASNIDTDVCVYPAAFIIKPLNLLLEF